MKSGRNYKKVALTLDYNDIKELKRIDSEWNTSKEVRKFIKEQLKQKLGLKKEEEKDKK